MTKTCKCGRNGTKLKVLHDRATFSIADWMRVVVWVDETTGSMGVEQILPEDPVPDTCLFCLHRSKTATLRDTSTRT